MRRIVFCGHHDAGKDEAAKFICGIVPQLTYGRSLSHYVAAELAVKLDVPVEVLRGPERHQYAMNFFHFADEVRASDAGHFVRQAFEVGDVITGIRDPREISYIRKNYPETLLVWIDRVVPYDPTMQLYGPELCDIAIPNRRSLAQFHLSLTRFIKFCGFEIWTEAPDSPKI